MSEKHNRDVIVGHTTDGIQEYDNPMPMWWLGILWFTIAFTIVFIPYLSMTGWTQEGQYDDEVAAADANYGEALAAAKAEAEAKRAELAAKGGSAEDVAAGKELFAVNCVACHAADGTGGIGPDLTDAEWIHGGTFADVSKTVSEGVLEKGMIAWGPVLGDEKVAQVSAFVMTLRKK